MHKVFLFLLSLGASLVFASSPIPSQVDMNTYKTPGKYSVPSNALFLNGPAGESGNAQFIVTSMPSISGVPYNDIMQIIFFASGDSYVRYRAGRSVNDWQIWIAVNND